MADAGPAAFAAASAGAPDPGVQAEDRAWTVLIAALGGEGGGVLSGWLVDAATADGRRVQATSVPGVAQRTGATTYYLEIGSQVTDPVSAGGPGAGASPPHRAAHDGSAESESAARRGNGAAPAAGPVMALLPTPGNVDLVVASELLEAGRAAQNGMITPERTTVIASTHRMFAIAEKSAMGDGRFDDERIRRAVRELARRHVLTDLGKVAQEAGTVLSSVLLGAVAGSEALPIPRAALRAAIERAGIAVEANLRGFDAGCRLFDHRPAAAGDPSADPAAAADAARLSASLSARVDALPETIRELARPGLMRVVDYQDERYGADYLARLEGLLEAARASDEESLAVVREAARQLALWMCFEDIIRVADLKTRRSRIERVRAEVRARPGQPVAITEFLKPGVDEWCSLLPAWIARPVLRAAERGGWRKRLNVGLHVRTSSVSGFLLLWTLARLRPLRRGMYRYKEERGRIEAWLARIVEALATSPAFALEAAKCANLVKGYGETYERGVRNFERTMGCLGDCAASPDPAASLKALREAALAEPEGRALARAVDALQGRGGADGAVA